MQMVFPVANNILIIAENQNNLVCQADLTRFERCKNLLQARQLYSQKTFRAVGLAIGDNKDELISQIEQLRQSNPQAKIFLLAQMFQEPAAIEMVRKGLADDYLICPVGITDFADVAVVSVVPAAAVATSVSPESRQQNERTEILEKLATVDDLTGAKNRRYVREFLRQIIEYGQKTVCHISLLIFDIDNFKSYNDKFGHQVGDKILKQAVVMMQQSCRKHDVVGRIGGDEFAVVFWDGPKTQRTAPTQERRHRDNPSAMQVVTIINRYRRELARTDLPALGSTGIGELTISGGLASYPQDGMTADELFIAADKALLEAKRSGKNRVYLVGTTQAQ